MKYDPNIHHRRSVRLRGYDYGKEGMYFITICTQNRVHFFGEVENGIMILNPFGEIAYRDWEKLPERWPHVELGAFQIMPNHMHGILLIHRPVSAVTNIETGTTIVAAPNDVVAPNTVNSPEYPFSKIQWATRPYLGQIIGAYKSTVSTACLNYHKQNQPGVWLDKSGNVVLMNAWFEMSGHLTIFPPISSTTRETGNQIRIFRVRLGERSPAHIQRNKSPRHAD